MTQDQFGQCTNPRRCPTSWHRPRTARSTSSSRFGGRPQNSSRSRRVEKIARAAERLLRNVIHEDGGPLIHNGSEEEQRSCDSTCRKLHRFLTQSQR
jgi:hypothetical protein